MAGDLEWITRVEASPLNAMKGGDPCVDCQSVAQRGEQRARDTTDSWRLLKMAETNLKQIAQSVIPDDPEASAYRFIIVAAKRARQLQSGARSFLPTTSKKPTVMAMEEVRRGLVQYEDIAIHHTLGQAVPEE
jgi:DNA-directed RNA polymerase subunit omega